MMKRYILAILLVFSSIAHAEGEAIESLVLAKAPVDVSDIESVKRGAKFFATTCMACHTMKYMRYNKLANEAGVTYDKMPLNVKTWPFGITPPDLSLEASVRGADWIWTYLHSFYKDPARPTGANNLLVPNTAMTPILTPYQGDQELVPHPMTDLFGHTEWYDNLVLVKQGSMTPEQFDDTVRDIVNFLAYAAEPYQNEQHTIGWWVLGFLVFFFVFAYKLKCEYWKDVKKHKKD